LCVPILFYLESLAAWATSVKKEFTFSVRNTSFFLRIDDSFWKEQLLKLFFLAHWAVRGQ